MQFVGNFQGFLKILDHFKFCGIFGLFSRIFFAIFRDLIETIGDVINFIVDL